MYGQCCTYNSIGNILCWCQEDIRGFNDGDVIITSAPYDPRIQSTLLNGTDVTPCALCRSPSTQLTLWRSMSTGERRATAARRPSRMCS